MTIQIELSQVIGLLMAFASLIGLGVKLLLVGLDQRLKRIEDQNKIESDGWKRLERELLEMKAELPLMYVRREDYVRGQTVIEAKLDALYQKLEVVQLRAAKDLS